MNKNALAITSIIIALIVLFFGNNLCERYLSKAPDGGLEIAGEWDEKKADSIVYGLMNEYGKKNGFNVSCFEDNCKIHHKIINHYWVELEEKKSYVTVAYTKPDDEMEPCRHCAAPLSIFEFKKTEGGYKLILKYYNKVTLGIYGNPPKKIAVFPIGYDIFGIEMIDEIDWPEGIRTETYSIYCQVADDLKEVLNIEENKYYIEDGYPDSDFSFSKWESKVETIKEGRGPYDIQVDVSGILDGKAVNERKKYRFNGVGYEEL